MRSRRGGLWAGGVIALAAGSLLAEPARLPVISGKEAVAVVNGEPISLEELLRGIGTLHQGVTEPASKRPRPDPSALLQRLINSRLILQEARKIGLDQLPEVTSQVEANRLNLLKSALVQQQVGGITSADPKDVERIYRDAVREVRIDSVLFGKEDDAKAFSSAIRAGSDFKALSAEAIRAGKGKGGEGDRYLKVSELRPEVLKVVSAMGPGGVSAPIRLTEGFTVVKLLDVRTPENPEARRKAEEEALRARKQARLEEYMSSLRVRYGQVDRPLLKSLDYESKEPGLARLRKDSRIVAQVKGGRPVTVKELTEGVEKKFYHGVDQAIEKKRVNAELPLILDRIVLERATLLEAKRLRMERTDAYRSALEEGTNGLLFGAFVRKVIDPGIKPDAAQLQKYYRSHLSDYTTPEMMRIEGLAFRRREDAQSALEKLRKGTDLKWMRANAEGQVARDGSETLLDFNGKSLVLAALPQGAQKALAGAGAGDFRFYAEPKGPFYVLGVTQATPAAPRAYESAKDDVAAKVFELQRKASLDEWAAKLRAASEIKIFAEGSKLNDILGLKSGEGK